MSFFVEHVRTLYPALSDGFAWLDGAAGTQVPQTVIDAITGVYTAGVGNVHGAFPASERADAIVTGARAAVADLVGADPRGVVLGPNMTTLTYRFARTLADSWRPGDEVVVSRLDHDANVRPWVQAAERAGATVRWAEIDVGTGELPAPQYDDLINARTRLVAVTAASNVLGTRPDVAAITAKARRVGALSYVDGVHATPHVPTDIAALGCDFYATSSYKWSGPHLGRRRRRPRPARDPPPGQAGLLPSRGAGPVRDRNGPVRRPRRAHRGRRPPRRARPACHRDAPRAGVDLDDRSRGV